MSRISVLVIAAALGVLCLASTAQAQRTHRVLYRVVGAHFDVTYANASGATEQQDGKVRRFQREFDAPAGAFLYLSAQNNDEDGGVRCMIDIDGKRVQYASSQGDYVIASCSASVPD